MGPGEYRSVLRTRRCAGRDPRSACALQQLWRRERAGLEPGIHEGVLSFGG